MMKAAVTIKPVDPDAAQRADAALRAVRSAPEEKQAAAAAPVAKKDPLEAAREGADGLEGLLEETLLEETWLHGMLKRAHSLARQHRVLQ